MLGFEQPHVLDRDRRLVGEGLDQSDLLVRERPHHDVVNDDDAQQVIAFEDRHSKDGAEWLDIFRPVCVFRIGSDIGDLDGSVLERGTGCNAVAAGPNWISLEPIHQFPRSVVGGRHPQHLAVETKNVGPVGPTQSAGALGHRFKHRTEIESRAADDLQHLRGRGLLLQRFAQLIEQAGVLDGDDGLAGEALYQLDLLIVEGPHLLAIEENSANQFIFLEHRHAQHRPHATEFDGCDDDWIASA